LNGIEMSGETDLKILLRSMSPMLDPDPYGFAAVTTDEVAKFTHPFALVHEAEGTTIVDRLIAFEKAGMQRPEKWARITLHIHSSLQAVGLTAAFATALGKVGISANVIAGFHHDHILVQWERRHDAMVALHELAQLS
jgi:uncharacterized protein